MVRPDSHLRSAEKDRQEATRAGRETAVWKRRGLSVWLCRGLASGYVAFFWCKLSTHASVIGESPDAFNPQLEKNR